MNQNTAALPTRLKPLAAVRLQYLLAFLLIGSIVAGLAALDFQFEKQRHLDRALVATQNIADLQARNLTHLFDKIDIALQSGAVFYQHELREGTYGGTELEKYLRHFDQVIPETDGIHVVNASGAVTHGLNVTSPSTASITNSQFFTQALNQAPGAATLLVDGPLILKPTQDWIVVFARRLNRPDGTFAGVIFASLSTVKLEGILSSANLGPTGAATVRTTDLALVHRFPDTRKGVGTRTVSKELKDITARQPLGGQYIAATALDGIERSNAYRRVGTYPFYVIVGLATRDFIGDGQENMVIIIGLAVLSILLTALACYRGYRSYIGVQRDLKIRTSLNTALQATLGERDALNTALEKKAREAQAASKAKSEFLANMSHELRTPLHQIDSLAQLIRREPLTPRQTDRIGILQTAVRHLTGLLDAVLEVTRLESDNLQLNETPLDLGAFITATLRPFQQAALAKSIALNAPVMPDLPPLMADPVYLQKALGNYLANAVRFTNAGRIDVSLQVIREDDNRTELRFSVSDTGPGIAPQDRPRLFRLFEQIDNSSTRNHDGMGLGLIITQRIARAMGGDAGCISELGRGSTFWFSVCLRKATQTPADENRDLRIQNRI